MKAFRSLVFLMHSKYFSNFGAVLNIVSAFEELDMFFHFSQYIVRIYVSVYV